MMQTLLQIIKGLAKELALLGQRFLRNQARNDYEQIIFDAIRLVVVRYGRI